MNFVDEVEIDVQSGRGGDGCVSFRRERFRPRGGPDGGNGGKGGSVVLQADSGLSTLLDQRYTKVYRAKNGLPGLGSDKYGASAEDIIVKIPVGTLVYDSQSNELLADLDSVDTRIIVARGGDGGKGNLFFKNSVNRSPRKAEPGEPGEKRKLRLELKLLADVGVVGYPNTGKSSLVARLSRARPKIADYPFTTLVPTLGVVGLGEDSSFVMADVPGLIEGAADGLGLGHRFLRHVERCKVLVHLTTWEAGDPDGVDAMIARLDILENEMKRYDPTMAAKPRIMGISKLDLPEVKQRIEELSSILQDRGYTAVSFSSATGENLDGLLGEIAKILNKRQTA